MAKKTVGNLAVNVSLKTSALAKGAKKAKSIATGVVGHFKGAFGKLTLVGGGLAGLAGAASFTLLVKNSMAAIDAQSKLADELGISVRNLKGLQFAAEQSGGSADIFSKAMIKMNRNIGEAMNGVGTAGPMLQKLGLDVESLSEMDAGETFKTIADEIAKLPDPAQQSAAAFNIFGRSGSELLTMLKAGSVGLAAMVDENERLGNSFSRVDAAKVEAANDAMNRMSKVVTGVGQNFAIELAPWITGVADKIVDLTTKSGGFGKIATSSVKMVVKGVGMAADIVHTTKLGFMFLEAGAIKGLASVLSGINTVGKGLEGLVNLIPGVEVSFTKGLEEMADGLHQIAGEQLDEAMNELAKPPPSEGINKFFDDIKKGADEAAKAITEANKNTDKTGKSLVELGEKVKAMKELEKFSKGIISSTESPLEKLNEKKGKLKESFDAGFLNQEQYDKGLEKIKKEAKSALKIEIPKSEMDQFKAKVNTLKNGLASGLINQQEFETAITDLESNAKDKLGKDAPVSAATGGFEDIRSSVGISAVMQAIKAEQQASHVDNDRKKQLELSRDQLTALEVIKEWAENQDGSQFALASINY